MRQSNTSWPDTPPVAPLESSETLSPAASRRATRPITGQKWTRLVHVYTSMAALLVVLFFGATGITLNHPDWTFGLDTKTSTATGALPDGAIGADGDLVFLTVSEYLRAEFNIRGSVTDFGSADTQSYLSYRGPGYAADVSIDTANRSYALTVEQQGLLGVANDLHKGRYANTSWRWVVDLAGGLLVAIALTGIGLQLFLKRRRRAAVTIAAIGGLIPLILAIVTLR